MVRSSSCKYGLLFLLSLMPPLVADEANQAEVLQSIQTAESHPAQTLADILKHALTAGLIQTCEEHKVEQLNAKIHAPTEDATFTSTAANNGNGITERLARMTGATPTITITASTTIKEGATPTNFQRAMIAFANDPTLKCTQKADASGNTITCSILLTMQEFYTLKETYKNTP